MQQHKIVKEYLDNVIPKKISPKTQDELREEMESHIYDRADFYMEIGYDEATYRYNIEIRSENGVITDYKILSD